MPATRRGRDFSLRLLAYRYSLQPSDSDTRPEHFSCIDCLPPPARRQGLRLDPGKQRLRLCVLPGNDCSGYDWNRPIKPVWMGRPMDYANAGKPNWTAPLEPINEMGCPGAWIRSPFAESLRRYYRRRTEKGDRVENPALTQCTDPLVHEAIATLEAYEDAAHGEYMRRFYADQRAKQKQKAGQR